MLQAISWTDYLTATTFLVASYYFIVGLLLYGNEIKVFITSRKRSIDTPPESINTEADTKSWIGRTHSTHQDNTREVQVFTIEELAVAPSDQPEETVTTEQADQETMLIGAVADLLDELKVQAQKTAGWKKDEYSALFRDLLAHYPQLQHTPYQESINLFIINTFQESHNITFSIDEVQHLWPQHIKS